MILMMKLCKQKHLILVNCLTISRIPLSILAYMELSAEKSRIICYLLLFCAIAASDFFDGKAARIFRIQSNFGAAADVFCDFFYIITSGYALYRQGLFPLWMLVLITVKLIEFIMTSRASSEKNCRHIFIFDYIGRYTAVGFYALPTAIILFNRLLSAALFYAVSYTIYATMLVSSFLSTAYRISTLTTRKTVVAKPIGTTAPKIQQ